MHTYVVLAYKQSEFLEDCIKSVLHQKYPSKVIIATSTPNNFIQNLATKYSLAVAINPNPGKGIGYDFDFAISVSKSNLTTIAHQDDIYDYEYSYEIYKAYKKHPDSLILFSDYYELRNGKKVYTNLNLKIKRILLIPLRSHVLSGTKLGKRLSLRFGNAVACPAVTFVKNNIKSTDIFKCNLLCNVDWYAWENLSIKKGKFTFIPQPLMGHRIHHASTTTEIINAHIRTEEDFIMLQKFWPKPIAKFINKFYAKAEDSNS